MEEINIFIDNFDDIFNQFDKSDISDELALFIENRCSRIKKNELVIYIHTKCELNSTEKELIVDAIRKHFGLETKYNLIESNRRKIANMLLIIAGVLIILLKNLTTLFDTVLDILDIIGCFIIWESAYNLIFTDNEEDIKRDRSKKISNSLIKFKVEVENE